MWSVRSTLAVAVCALACSTAQAGGALARSRSGLLVRGGATKPAAAACGFNKKTFTAVSCLRDHVTIASQLPLIFGGYVGPFAIPAETNEAIMLAVNSANNCPYCTGLHGELGRMAGLKGKVVTINTAKSVADVKKASGDLTHALAVAYARQFGEANGRGAALEASYATLKQQLGAGRAASVRALCWFLQWGSISGNTLNSFFKGRLAGKPKCGSNPLFELVFAVYYSGCYVLIMATTLLLKMFPEVPAFVNALLGAVLTCVAGLWILPVGLLGLVISIPVHLILALGKARAR